MCDLSTANAQGILNAEAKIVSAAAVYSAVTFLHEKGVMHRFINPGECRVSPTCVIPVYLAFFRPSSRCSGGVRISTRLLSGGSRFRTLVFSLTSYLPRHINQAPSI